MRHSPCCASAENAPQPATRGCSSAWCYRRQRQGSSRLGGRARDATTCRINSAGPGRVESGLPMKTKTHFTFRVDIWDDTGDSIVEHIAGVDDFEVAEATYRAAVARWPTARITLRQGARVVLESEQRR